MGSLERLDEILPFFWLVVWLVMGTLACVRLLSGSVLLVMLEPKDLTKILLLSFLTPQGYFTVKTNTHKKMCLQYVNKYGLLLIVYICTVYVYIQNFMRTL